MKIKRVGIIGRAADGKEIFDGQTISTRLWRDEFNKRLPEQNTFMVDTYDYKHHVIEILLKWLKCMFSCSHIVVILSGNGLSFFLPLLFYSNKLFHRKIYHRVIGGELDEYVKKHPGHEKYLDSLEVNWVQSNNLIIKLEELGINNAVYLENFRNISPIKLQEEPIDFSVPFRFCTFSRITESKGIGIAIMAIAQVNEWLGNNTAVLDVYGPVEDQYIEIFETLTNRYSDCVKYMGSIPSNEAVNTLKDYFIHLFPTTWSGEGFPGTLIDCYNAGLPTIASNWAYNSEYIQEGETGYLYDWRKPELLAYIIKNVIENSHLVSDMKKKCIQEAGKYQCDTVMQKVIATMENYI